MQARRAFVALLMAGAGMGEAFPDPAAHAAAEISAQRIVEHVRELASDDYEGRAPGTRGEERTLAYLERELRAAGVQPGAHGAWTQEVPLVSKRITGKPRLRIRGAHTRTLKPGGDFVAGSPQVRERVRLEEVPVVFAGYGIVAPEYGWDDYAQLDVDGKVVLLLPNDPGRVSEDSTFFKGRALTWYGTLNYKFEEAARHGARAVLFVHDPEAAGYPWETIAGIMRQRKLASVPSDQSAPQPEAGVTVRREVGVELLRDAGYDLAELEAQASQPGFRGRPLSLAVDLQLDVELGRSVSHNVIGWVPGTDRADEYVLYTAHWDHVGIGAPVDGDSIYNGAVDNASGTAVLLELARTFATLDPGPRRSVVFIATTAEEQGLLGSYHYADHPVFPLEATAAALNLDALFPFGDFEGMTVVALGSSEIENYLRVAATAEGRVLEPDPSPEQGAFFRSDHYPFAKKGVPALFAVGGPAGAPSADDPVVQRFTDYVTRKYHKPSDEYDDTWDVRGIVGDARIYFRTGLAIANDDRFPNWYFGSEFRALRDRSLRPVGRTGW